MSWPPRLPPACLPAFIHPSIYSRHHPPTTSCLPSFLHSTSPSFSQAIQPIRSTQPNSPSPLGFILSSPPPPPHSGLHDPTKMVSCTCASLSYRTLANRHVSHSIKPIHITSRHSLTTRHSRTQSFTHSFIERRPPCLIPMENAILVLEIRGVLVGMSIMQSSR